jgi:hypothetical protein
VYALDDCVDVGRRQPELSDGMRRTLIDWITEVVEVKLTFVCLCSSWLICPLIQEYNLQTATLFLAVHMLDRLLLMYPTKKNQFQLLGSGCLLIASKIEDVEVSCKALIYCTQCMLPVFFVDITATIVEPADIHIGFHFRRGGARLNGAKNYYVAFIRCVCPHETLFLCADVSLREGERRRKRLVDVFAGVKSTRHGSQCKCQLPGGCSCSPSYFTGNVF